METTELRNSLIAYVRNTDDGLVDTRRKTALEFAALDVQDVINLMAEVPADLAAILSGCVAVTSAADLVDGKKRRATKKPDESVPKLLASDMPEIADFLNRLQASDEVGRKLYIELTLLLRDARNEPDLRPLLCGVGKDASTEASTFTDFEAHQDGVPFADGQNEDADDTSPDDGEKETSND